MRHGISGNVSQSAGHTIYPRRRQRSLTRAAISVYTGISFTILGLSATSLSAFAGALIAISFVYSISRFRFGFSGETLLLTGVAISFFFSSLILFIQYLSNVADSFQIIRWLMGSLTVVGYQELKQLLPFVMLTAVVIIYLSRELNLLMAGDEIATSRGVSVKYVRYALFLLLRCAWVLSLLYAVQLALSA